MRRKSDKTKDSSILIKIDKKTREHFKDYADANERGMSEIIREHIESDIKEYEQIGRRKKPVASSKDSGKIEMEIIYHATNILNSLEEMNVECESIKKEVKRLWDIVG